MNTHSYNKAGAAGYSLLEVLVALLIISISLLGVAGMQAISINNTGVAGFRSVAAMQASSMAAAMSANESYWQATGVATQTSVSGSTITSSDSTLSGTPACGTSACAPSAMATYDLKNWGTALAAALPGGTAQINCTVAGTAPTVQATCQILINWVEKNVVQNQSSGASATAGTSYDFEMVVLP